MGVNRGVALRLPQEQRRREPSYTCRVCDSLQSPCVLSCLWLFQDRASRAECEGVWWWYGDPRSHRTLCDGSQANPPELDQAEDLASLVSVNESSVLNTLLNRYRAQLPHTSTGPDLIVLQPRGPSAPSAGKVRGTRARGQGTGTGRVEWESLCISGEESSQSTLQTWL